MQANLAPILGLTPADVNVKATTTELMGFAGRGEGMAAYAVVLVEKIVNGFGKPTKKELDQNSYEYDVAFSFLSQDEASQQSSNDLLQDV